MKKRYVFAGASGRALGMFAKPLAKDYSDVAEIVGVYDINWKRSELLVEETGLDFPVYRDFDKMLKEAKPDVVIVTTVDAYHHEYIIKALEAGCDAITEKPMTTDEEKCNAILEAEKRTGKKVTVTFNYRFMPYMTKARELIKNGAIGEVLSVHFEYLLSKSHGSSYFRRWNGHADKSGTLLVHKSTHHFDLVNWIIGEDPVKVNAFGTRRLYGPDGIYAKYKGQERCLTCKYKKECPFYYDITKNETEVKRYLDCEDVDGYLKDACIFRDSISIYDNMTVNVKYNKGTMMSYTLTTNTAYEDLTMCINGSKGRMVIGNLNNTSHNREKAKIKIISMYNEETNIIVAESKGGHGGGDPKIRDMLFREGTADPLGHIAGTKAGAMSIIIGIAARESIEKDKAVYVKDLLDMNLLGN